MKQTMAEIAERIDAHLKRFEADPKINARMDGNRMGLKPYFNAGAHFTSGDKKVRVIYISFQVISLLSRKEAEAYLAWLDAGNVGRHWQALSQRTTAA